MATQNVTIATHGLGAPATGPFSGISGWFRRVMLRREVRNRTLRELESLSERDLADIGIHPADIHRIAREAGNEAVMRLR